MPRLSRQEIVGCDRDPTDPDFSFIGRTRSARLSSWSKRVTLRWALAAWLGSRADVPEMLDRDASQASLP